MIYQHINICQNQRFLIFEVSRFIKSLLSPPLKTFPHTCYFSECKVCVLCYVRHLCPTLVTSTSTLHLYIFTTIFEQVLCFFLVEKIPEHTINKYGCQGMTHCQSFSGSCNIIFKIGRPCEYPYILIGRTKFQWHRWILLGHWRPICVIQRFWPLISTGMCEYLHGLPISKRYMILRMTVYTLIKMALLWYGLLQNFIIGLNFFFSIYKCFHTIQCRIVRRIGAKR